MKSIDKLTNHEKTLLIAKKMFSEDSVSERVSSFHEKYNTGATNYKRVIVNLEEFNPYKNGEDSQKIQEFFKLGMHYLDDKNVWFVGTYKHDKSPESFNKELKSAIADCAVEIIIRGEHEK